MKIIKDIAEANGLKVELYRGAGPFRDVFLTGSRGALLKAEEQLKAAGFTVITGVTTNPEHPEVGRPVLLLESIIWETAVWEASSCVQN